MDTMTAMGAAIRLPSIPSENGRSIRDKIGRVREASPEADQYADTEVSGWSGGC